MTDATVTTACYSAQQEIALPVGETFRLFTEHFGQWYEVNSHSVINPANTESVTLEGFVGGRLMEVANDPASSGSVLGTVSLWEPPHRFSFVDLNDCEVAVTFLPLEQGTRVRIAVTLLRAQSTARARQIEKFGWHTLLPLFASILHRAAQIWDPTTRNARNR